MQEQDYVVAIILDPLFGERLRQVAERNDLWTVPSPVNREVVQDLWAQDKAGRGGHTVTMWSHPPIAPEDWLGMLEEIELHHGEYSHNPPVSVLEVFGSKPTHEARAALGEYGYLDVVETVDGFRAKRRVDWNSA